MSINLAIAATQINSIYDECGVDLVESHDDGYWTPIEWVPANSVEDDLGAADAILLARGLRRTGDWEFVGDYHAAPVEATE